MQADAQFRDQIKGYLSQHQRFVAEPVDAGTDSSPRSPSAVAVAVTELGHGADVGGLPRYKQWQTKAALMLTRRSIHLRNHPGQWAFPGGRCDPGESVEQTALREMSEEIGLEVGADQVLGLLDDFVTRSGFVITPVVVWVGAAKRLVLSEAEVASVHRIPMSQWLRADAPVLSRAPDSDQPILRMPVGSTGIAAPTAALIYQFREVCLLGLSTRVHHFEQPLFARK